ncbi:MAG: FitA-like ribbon-helix-helix domain-containing protein [Gammaproteobacteria bacterium]
MGTIVVKNLPESLHEKLKLQARRNHRSMTKEVVHLLEGGLNANGTQGSSQSETGTLAIEDIEAAITDNRFARYRSLEEVNAYVDELRADRDVAG